MGKWLAAGGVALLVLLVVMWRQLQNDATAAPTPPKPAAQTEEPSVEQLVKIAEAKHAEEAPVQTDPDKPAKIDSAGDEFTARFIELVPKKLSLDAATCYTVPKSKTRNQQAKFTFKMVVKDGVVTVHDVKLVKDTLNDPALTSCFFQKIARTTWTDEALPDYEWEDELVLNPERGLKKWTKANMEYVGEKAPPLVTVPDPDLKK